MKIHLDLDSFFVSAERVRHPFLRNIPIVVVKGSDKKIFDSSKKDGVIVGNYGAFNSILEFKNSYNTNNILNEWKKEFIDSDGVIRGIVIAKSYECKPYGIKTGTPLKDALILCPTLKIIPSDHLYYQLLSQRLKSYLELKIPILEQYSIDEWFGDLDGWIKDEDTLEFITNLRNEIKEKFDLPITIGASKSKWISKLLTDQIKPFGVYVLAEENVFEFTKNIMVSEFPGIGRAIQKKLDSYYINTLGELRKHPMLLYSYGKTGRELYNRICGTDNEKVIPYSDRRSIGISRNFKALQDRNEIYRRVKILVRYLSYTISKLELNPTTFYYKIRYEYSTKNSQSITFNRLFNEKFLIELSLSMIKKLDIHPTHKIHYIAISSSNFSTKFNQKTYSILDYDKDLKFNKLNTHLLKIRDKYGIDIVRYGES